MGKYCVNIRGNLEKYRQYNQEVKQLNNYRIFQDIEDKKLGDKWL